MVPTFAVVDDDPAARGMLADILSSRGEVIAAFASGQEALRFFESGRSVDICFVDLLMPDLSGIDVVEKVLALQTHTLFVMVSQVEAKALLADAYAAGIEFFVHKPINRKEILAVSDRVLEKLRLQTTLEQIEKSLAGVRHSRRVKQTEESKSLEETAKKRLQGIFADLGIVGETGSREVQAVILSFKNHEDDLVNLPLRQIYQSIAGPDEDVQSIEQRIRRVIKQAMENIALRGLEDFYDEYFERYASRYFDFAEVRQRVAELRRGKQASTARINIRKFLIALFLDIWS